MIIHGICDVNVIDDLHAKNKFSPGKPFLRLNFSDGIQVDITTNLAEMIGGIGAGVRKREEDKHGK